MQQKKMSAAGLIGGILFLVMAALQFWMTFQYSFNFWRFLYAGGLLFVGVLSLIGSTSAALAGGFGLLTVIEIYWLVTDLLSGSGGRAFIYIFTGLLDVLSMGLAALVVFMIRSRKEDSMRKLWFLPGTVRFLSTAVFFIYMILVLDRWFLNWRSTLLYFLAIAALLAVMYWVARDCAPAYGMAAAACGYNGQAGGFCYGNGVPYGAAYGAGGPAPAGGNMSAGKGYCDLIKHMLLLVFTFGIWLLIWIYNVTDYLNVTPGEERRNPLTKLLLCMFIPFYFYYWIYKSCQRIDKLAGRKGIPSELTSSSIILMLFGGMASVILMQEKINTICKARGASPEDAGVAFGGTPAAGPAPGFGGQAPAVNAVPYGSGMPGSANPSGGNNTPFGNGGNNSTPFGGGW